MSEKRPPRVNLRRRAEERLASRSAAEVTDPGEAVRLVHELQVHQIELELQNEELRDTRLALETSLERYTELFEFAPIGYLAIDASGVIRELNFAAARLLGVSRGALAGRPLATFVAKRDVEALERFTGEVFELDDQGPRTRSLELALVTAGGSVFTRISAALVKSRAPVALLAVEDVTARHRAEDALHEELRRRDDFLGTLSHELRNPLAPIRNSLFLLDCAPPGSEMAQRAVAVVERQVAHLVRLVDDLLDVTRIARGKLQLQRRVQDVAELVARTLDDYSSAFETAGVRLDARIERETPCWADVDATRLAQILGNLLANAVKFTARGGRTAVTLRPDGPVLLLSVVDTGAGVAPEVLERLFEPFSQGPQTLARSAGGLGLGLATVRGLVELHGGTVTMTSAGTGKGTEVTVRIPRSPAREAPRGAQVHRGKRYRVLVIDDNVDGASSLRDVLQTFGHEVVTAHDGAGGLAAARAFRPEVVLCDIGLPDADGYAVARALRADDELRSVHLVALSGYARSEDVQRCLEAGFDRHVAKPLAPDRLEELFTDLPLRPGPTQADSESA